MKPAAQILAAAIERRAPLLGSAGLNAYRVLSGRADDAPGLVLERFGDAMIMQIHEGRVDAADVEVRDLAAAAMHEFGCRAVYRKVFPRDRSFAGNTLPAEHAEPTPWLGEPLPEEIDSLENGVRFRIRPYDGFSVGLFLDQRLNRARIRGAASSRRVLNLFAYTCGFSVTAALGGASSVVSVDTSKRYLEWGKRNFTANGLPLDPHRFICSDVFEYFRRARRQEHAFDIVILDPPTFARSKHSRRVFSIAGDLPRLVAEAAGLLVSGGTLLLSSNHQGTTTRRLEDAIIAAARSRPVRILARPRAPLDFRGDESAAKVVISQL